MTAAAAVVILPPLGEVPLQPAREPDAQLLPILAEMPKWHADSGAEEWWVLRGCLAPTSRRDGPDGDERTRWVVLQRALGIAIVTVGAVDTDAEGRLRALLCQHGFAEMFAGDLPIVSVNLASTVEPAVPLLDCIRAAFANHSVELSVGDPDWPEWVVDVLFPPTSDPVGRAAGAAPQTLNGGPAGGEVDAPDALGGVAAPLKAAPRHDPPIHGSPSATAPAVIRAAGVVSLAALLAVVFGAGVTVSRDPVAPGPRAVEVALDPPSVRPSEPAGAAADREIPATGRVLPASAPSAVAASPSAERPASPQARRGPGAAAMRKTEAKVRRRAAAKATASVSSTVRAWGHGIAGWWRRLASQPNHAPRREYDSR